MPQLHMSQDRDIRAARSTHSVIQSARTLALPLAAVLIGACSTPMAPAPVVERSVYGAPVRVVTANNTAPVAVATAPTVIAAPTSANSANATFAATKPLAITPSPAAASSGLDGKTYAVKKGDTLYSIALENGLGYRDLALWNNISNPSYIQIDQVLRLTAPLAQTAALPSGTAVVQGSSVAQSTAIAMPTDRSVTVLPAVNAASTPVPVTVVSGALTQATASAVAANSPTNAAASVSDLSWQWPVAKAKLIGTYTEGKTKGIDFTGNLGDAIVAASDGKVVYAGSALKGYGQMLIVKHSEVYLTAYAHNSRLLVKEEAVVKRGQKIAEMGNSESDNGQIKLHFELRRSGKPTDPSKLLPAQ